MYTKTMQRSRPSANALERSERVNQCREKGAFAAAQHYVYLSGWLSIVVSLPCESVIWEIQTKKDFAHLRNANGARYIYYIHNNITSLVKCVRFFYWSKCFNIPFVRQFFGSQKFNIAINMNKNNLVLQSECLKTRNTDKFLVLEKI